jgi:hypothetical protein
VVVVPRRRPVASDSGRPVVSDSWRPVVVVVDGRRPMVVVVDGRRPVVVVDGRRPVVVVVDGRRPVVPVRRRAVVVCRGPVPPTPATMTVAPLAVGRPEFHQSTRLRPGWGCPVLNTRHNKRAKAERWACSRGGGRVASGSRRSRAAAPAPDGPAVQSTRWARAHQRRDEQPGTHDGAGQNRHEDEVALDSLHDSRKWTSRTGRRSTAATHVVGGAGPGARRSLTLPAAEQADGAARQQDSGWRLPPGGRSRHGLARCRRSGLCRHGTGGCRRNRRPGC